MLSNDALTTSNPESETYFTFQFTNGNNPSVHIELTKHGNVKRRYPASHDLVRCYGGAATGYIFQSDPIGSLYTMAATSATTVIARVLGTWHSPPRVYNSIYNSTISARVSSTQRHVSDHRLCRP